MRNNVNTEVNKKVALFVVALASSLTSYTSASIVVALPAIAREFAVDTILLSWIPTASVLVTAMLLIPFGRIADMYGRKRIFTWGIFVYTLAALLLGNAGSAAMMVSFLALMGLGNAMSFGTGVAILTSVYPSSERGKVLGIRIAVVYLGLSVGPFIGGTLTQYLGWRSIFFSVVPLGAIIVTSVLWKLKGEWMGARGEKFDLAGSIIYSLAILAVMYGFSNLPAISGVVAMSIGVLGFLAFVKWETRISHPILNMNLFKKNAAFAFSNLAALINYGSTFAITFLLSLYLQNIRGLTPQIAGLILITPHAIQAIFSPIAGRLSDRIEPWKLASTGMVLTTLGLALLYFLDWNTTIPFVLSGLAVVGCGLSLFASPNANAIMSSVEESYYGIASSTLATTRQIGFMLSMGIIMLSFSFYMGRTEITPEYYASFLKSAQTSFLVFASLCFGGIFASLARGNISKDNPRSV